MFIGYRWFPSALGWHIERALCEIGCVDFIGLGAPDHPGSDAARSLADLPASEPYLWIDPAGRYFPPGLEDTPALTAGYLVDCHIGHWRESAARFFDVVFLAQKSFVEPYRRLLGHDQVHWLPLGAAGDVHRDHGVERDLDVAFVGNIDRSHRNTPRARRLRLLADRYRTNDFFASAAPDEVGRIYSRAKIVFNTSITGDVTMRIFEAAASGALVLSDRIAPENGGEALFEPDREIAFYADDDDLCAKIDYFLAHDDERRAIARAGQLRVLHEHTYAHRAKRILQTLADPDLRRAAPMRRASAQERLRERLRVYTHLHMLDAVFDATRGLHPLRRAMLAAPCAARRILL
jgi:hypothetical protein